MGSRSGLRTISSKPWLYAARIPGIVSALCSGYNFLFAYIKPCCVLKLVNGGGIVV